MTRENFAVDSAERLLRTETKSLMAAMRRCIRQSLEVLQESAKDGKTREVSLRLVQLDHRIAEDVHSWEFAEIFLAYRDLVVAARVLAMLEEASEFTNVRDIVREVCRQTLLKLTPVVGEEVKSDEQ